MTFHVLIFKVIFISSIKYSSGHCGRTVAVAVKMDTCVSLFFERRKDFEERKLLCIYFFLKFLILPCPDLAIGSSFWHF